MIDLTRYQQSNLAIVKPSPTPIAIPTADPSTTANWKTYDGPYPLSFSYPSNLKIAEGDADYFSIIRLYDPLFNDKSQDTFTILMPDLDSESTHIANTLQDGYKQEKDIEVGGIEAKQFKKTDVIVVLLQAENQVYSIKRWQRRSEDDFQRLLKSVVFKNNPQNITGCPLYSIICHSKVSPTPENLEEVTYVSPQGPNCELPTCP